MVSLAGVRPLHIARYTLSMPPPRQLRLRVLAARGPNTGDESERLFLTLRSESAGEDVGIEMSGGAPTRVRSSLADRAFLVECFVNLFEVTHIEDSIRRALAADPGPLPPAT